MRTISLVVRHSIAALATLTVVSVVRAKEPISVVLDSWWNEERFLLGGAAHERSLVASKVGVRAGERKTYWTKPLSLPSRLWALNDPVVIARACPGSQERRSDGAYGTHLAAKGSEPPGFDRLNPHWAAQDSLWHMPRHPDHVTWSDQSGRNTDPGS